LKRRPTAVSHEAPVNAKPFPAEQAAARPITKFESDLMTRKEAAAYLGVSEMTLAIWKSTGRYSLRVYKIGRLAKYKKLDLDAFIESRMQAD
jgi:excisionase family DNA binding protein